MSQSAAKNTPQAAPERLIAATSAQENRPSAKQAKRKNNDDQAQVAMDAAEVGDVIVADDAAHATALSDAPVVLAQATAAAADTATVTATATVSAASATAAPAVSGWVMGLAALGGLALTSKGKSKDVDPAEVPRGVQGIAIDGYLVGATVFLVDSNGNKTSTGVLTDSQGRFSVQNPGGFLIQVEGGTNAETGLANTMVLQAPAASEGSIVVTPLTTLIQTLVANQGMSAAQAEAAVRTKLGITADVNLLSLDPIAANNLDVQKANVQIAVAITQVTNASELGAVMTALSAALTNNASSFDLNTALLQAIQTQAPGVDDAVLAQLQTQLASLATATSMSEIGEKQAQAAEELAQAATQPTPIIVSPPQPEGGGGGGGGGESTDPNPGPQVLTLSDALTAANLPTSYAIDSSAVANLTGLKAADAAAMLLSAEAILQAASNAADLVLSDLLSYTLLDSLDSLSAADQGLLSGAASYALTDIDELTAQDLDNQTVAGLAAAQAAAIEAVLTNPVVAGASNFSDAVFVRRGDYTLLDSLESLSSPEGVEVLGGADSYALSVTVFVADSLGDFSVDQIAALAEQQASVRADFFSTSENALILGATNGSEVKVHVPSTISGSLSQLTVAKSSFEDGQAYVISQDPYELADHPGLFGLVPAINTDFSSAFNGWGSPFAPELESFMRGVSPEPETSYAFKVLLTGDVTKGLDPEVYTAMDGDLSAAAVYAGQLADGETGHVYVQWVPIDNGGVPDLKYKFITSEAYNSSQVVRTGLLDVVEGASSIALGEINMSLYAAVTLHLDPASLGQLRYAIYEFIPDNLFELDSTDQSTGQLREGVADALSHATSVLVDLPLSVAQQAALDGLLERNPALGLRYSVLDEIYSDASVLKTSDQSVVGHNDLDELRLTQFLTATSGDISVMKLSTEAKGETSDTSIYSRINADAGHVSVGDLQASASGRNSSADLNLSAATIGATHASTLGNAMLVASGIDSRLSSRLAVQNYQDEANLADATLGFVNLQALNQGAQAVLSVDVNSAAGDAVVNGLDIRVADEAYAEASVYVQVNSDNSNGAARVGLVNVWVDASTTLDSAYELELDISVYATQGHASLGPVSLTVGSASQASVGIRFGTSQSGGSLGIDGLQIDVQSQAQLDLRLFEDWVNDSLTMGSVQLAGSGVVNMTLGGYEQDIELTTFDFSQADVSLFTGQLNFSADQNSTAIGSVKGTAHGEMLDMRALSSDLSLNAGAGDDVLLGSRGQDLLTGGVGADVFQLTLGHSGSTTSTADVITDLTMGDQIDLTGLLSLLDGVFVTSNKSSEFVGSASFVDLIGLDDDKFDVWVGSRDGRDYLVCETSADGSTTELIDIGTSASVNLSNWNFSAGVITIG
jgi:hypothetical protein